MLTGRIGKLWRFTFPLIIKNLDKMIAYHDQFHTLRVSKASRRIAKGERVPRKIIYTRLLPAAILRDTGFLKTKNPQTYADHEEKSIEIAEFILPKFQYKKAEIENITELIRSTKPGFKAEDIVQKALNDADTDDLGCVDFPRRQELLRNEWEVFRPEEYRKRGWDNDYNWYKFQLDFLENMEYKTEHQRKCKNTIKQLNINYLEGILNSLK